MNLCFVSSRFILQKRTAKQLQSKQQGVIKRVQVDFTPKKWQVRLAHDILVVTRQHPGRGEEIQGVFAYYLKNQPNCWETNPYISRWWFQSFFYSHPYLGE